MGAVASALGGHGLGAVGRCFLLRPGNNVLGCGFAMFSKGTTSKCVILPSNRHEAFGYSVPVGGGCLAAARGRAGLGLEFPVPAVFYKLGLEFPVPVVLYRGGDLLSPVFEARGLCCASAGITPRAEDLGGSVPQPLAVPRPWQPLSVGVVQMEQDNFGRDDRSA